MTHTKKIFFYMDACLKNEGSRQTLKIKAKKAGIIILTVQIFIIFHYCILADSAIENTIGLYMIHW